MVWAPLWVSCLGVRAGLLEDRRDDESLADCEDHKIVHIPQSVRGGVHSEFSRTDDEESADFPHKTYDDAQAYRSFWRASR